MNIDIIPNCLVISSNLGDNGDPFRDSIVNWIIWPPSSIGIGNKLITPKLILMRAKNFRNWFKPALADTPAYLAILNGPLIFFVETSPLIILVSIEIVKVVVDQV